MDVENVSKGGVWDVAYGRKILESSPQQTSMFWKHSGLTSKDW